MKKFTSLTRFSSYYNDDVWGRIYRLNKCVKAFKYISYSSSARLKRRYQRKFQINSNYYYKRTKAYSASGMLNKVNSFGRRLWGRHKLQYFYGKLTKYEFRNKLRATKGKTSYSRVGFLFNRFECRVDISLFRAGWFTETLMPFQLVFHGFISIDGRISKSPFEVLKVGELLSLSEFVYDRREIIRRINLQTAKFAFQSNYIVPSEYLPILIIWRPFRIANIKIFPNTSKYGVLRFNFLLHLEW